MGSPDRIVAQNLLAQFNLELNLAQFGRRVTRSIQSTNIHKKWLLINFVSSRLEIPSVSLLHASCAAIPRQY